MSFNTRFSHCMYGTGIITKKQSCTKEVYINIAMKKTYIYEVFKEMTKGNETNIRFMNPKIIIVIVGK